MRIQVPTLKLRTQKKFILAVVSAILVVLLILGMFLFQVNSLFRKHVLCPFCAITDTPTDSDIYMISHTKLPNGSADQAFLYTLDAQTGKVKHGIDLHEVGWIEYFRIINGISYVIASDSNETSYGNKTLLATRLSDGKTLWSKFLGPVVFSSAIATSTVLYLHLVSNPDTEYLTAINMKDGLPIWRYNPQLEFGAEILLDKNSLLIQTRAESIAALRADNGERLWSHDFHVRVGEAGDLFAPIVEDSHVFFVYAPFMQTSKIFEFDEKTGSLLWQRKLNVGETIASLHIKNHCLLIETMEHKLYVLRDSDKSVIWSSTFQSSSTPQQPDEKWIYTDDIAYSLSSEIDPQTFAINRVLRAWQINNGRKLFQVNLTIADKYEIDRIQNQLIFTGTNNVSSDSILYNDVEVRQAKTGNLLWHKQIGRPLATCCNNGYIPDLSIVKPEVAKLSETAIDGESGFQSIDFGYTAYYQPDDGGLNQSILYVIMYDTEHKAQMLYALNMQNGLALWQISTDNFNLLHHKQEK